MKLLFAVLLVAAPFGMLATEDSPVALPTPVNLLKHLGTLEQEAVSSINRFYNTSNALKRLATNLKLGGKVNRSNVCWQYIGANMQSQIRTEKDAATAINERFKNILPLTRQGGQNLTKLFAAMVEAGKECNERCSLESYEAKLANETEALAGRERALCAATIEASVQRMQSAEAKRQEKLSAARSMMMAESSEAARVAQVDMSLQAGKLGVVSRPNLKPELVKGNIDARGRHVVNVDSSLKEKQPSVTPERNVSGRSAAIAKQDAPAVPAAYSTQLDTKKVAKEYFIKAQRKMDALDAEEARLESAVAQLTEVYSKMKQQYVDPRAELDIMVGDCHDSLKKQADYFKSSDLQVHLKHTHFVRSALQAQKKIKETQARLDARNHCREQMLQLVGAPATPLHVIDDMVIRHDKQQFAPKKIQHLPHF
eukprot:Stramenopile-MAST_4_protein_561